MAFWTDAQFEDPKRAYRFLVTIGRMPSGAQWYAKSCKKPEISISTVEHNFLNHRFYYPGRAEWSEVSVVLVDPVSPDAAINTAAIIRAGGYNPPSGPQDTATISKQASVAAIGTVAIEQIDALGKPIETWTLWNPFVTGVTYGDLDYSSDEMTEITMTIRYDWAVIETKERSDTGLNSPDGKPVDSNTFFNPGESK
tara:strand:- start:1994 stop:2584 length:591 start_codon:yes stop_codon:yes gene_type:complete